MKDKNKKILKKIAKESIKKAIIGEGVKLNFENIDSELNKKRGIFVTLYKNNRLRGCIGKVKENKKPIYKSVSDMAISAALKDNRFLPVTLEEIDDLNIQISILSSLKKIDKPKKEIKLGKHGVYIEKAFNTAVYLPEVAKETNWSLNDYMGNLCKKAGLEERAWQKGDINIYIFTTNTI